jgi:hypothetical protein
MPILEVFGLPCTDDPRVVEEWPIIWLRHTMVICNKYCRLSRYPVIRRMPTPEDDAQSVSWNAFCHSGWPASPPMIVTKLKPVASGPVNAQMRRRRRAAATPALCDNCFMLISHSRTGRCIRQRNRVLSWHPQITTEGASARCFV